MKRGCKSGVAEGICEFIEGGAWNSDKDREGEDDGGWARGRRDSMWFDESIFERAGNE